MPMDLLSPNEQQALKCPITLEYFVDPVIAADGHTYEREALLTWLASKNKSPITGLPLDRNAPLIPNHTLRSFIQILNPVRQVIATPAITVVPVISEPAPMQQNNRVFLPIATMRMQPAVMQTLRSVSEAVTAIQNCRQPATINIYIYNAPFSQNNMLELIQAIAANPDSINELSINRCDNFTTAEFPDMPYVKLLTLDYCRNLQTLSIGACPELKTISLEFNGLLSTFNFTPEAIPLVNKIHIIRSELLQNNGMVISRMQNAGRRVEYYRHHGA